MKPESITIVNQSIKAPNFGILKYTDISFIKNDIIQDHHIKQVELNMHFDTVFESQEVRSRYCI